MYFGNRWVPMEVMDTIVLLWAIVALIIGFILFLLWRKDHAARAKPSPLKKEGGAKKKKKKRR